MKGLQEGAKSLVETVERMEEKKMDRLDQIITKCVGYGVLYWRVMMDGRMLSIF